MSVNRGKHSITLDFSVCEGAAILHSLVAQGDVIIVNLVARAQKKLGLDSETLRALNKRLIHVSLTGFGLQGERADWPCYDLIAEGYSGVVDLTGETDGPPQKVGTPAADLLAGHDAAMAVLAALYRRGRDGVGCDIEISMVESMARFMAPRLMSYLGAGELSRRSGGRDSVIAIYQIFETTDEPMTLGLGNDAIWKRFRNTVGRADLANDLSLSSNADRRERRSEIVKVIANILLKESRSHWLELPGRARVPAGPIYRLDEVANAKALHRLDSYTGVMESPGRYPKWALEFASTVTRKKPACLRQRSERIRTRFLHRGWGTRTRISTNFASGILSE